MICFQRVVVALCGMWFSFVRELSASVAPATFMRVREYLCMLCMCDFVCL